MDDAGAVRGVERERGLPDGVGQLGQRRARTADPLAQGQAVDHLGDDEMQVALLAHVEDGENVRVVEGGGGPDFALEAGEPLRVGGEVGREDFNGHVAAEQ